MNAFIPGVGLREAGAFGARLGVKYPRGIVVSGVVVRDGDVAVHALTEDLHQRRRRPDGGRSVPWAAGTGPGRRTLHRGRLFSTFAASGALWLF